jgi:AGCS family alanine or glycine:cation symporter
MADLEMLRDSIWTWVAAPVLAIVAIVVTVMLRAPQLTRLGEGFRAAFARDPKAPGILPPATVLLLGTAATWGSAAAVSAATAVSLGGPGAIAWLWLFGLLLAPLRYAETLLARTSPPGKAGADAKGSLGARLAADDWRPAAGLGQALGVLVPLAAFAWIGGAHGTAVAEIGARVVPDGGLAVGLAVALVSALLVALALGRAGVHASTFVGWLALAALATVLGVCIVAFFHDAGRGFGAFGRALDDATSGAEAAGAFSGALAGEIAAAALVHVLPPLASFTGVSGALDDAAKAPTARQQAAVSLLAPLFHVVLATVLGFSFVATGAFSRRTEDQRPLAELTLWRSGFDTVSQRLETRGDDDRTFGASEHGGSEMLRVIDGMARARPLEVATARGMVTSARFVDGDRPADFAARVEHGRIVQLLMSDEDGTLAEVPFERISSIRVEGRMLPTGAGLVAVSASRAGGDAARQILLVALLLAAAIGAAGWGVAVSRSLRAPFAFPAAFLPSAGLLLGASGAVPWLAPFGSVVAALLATVAAIGILAKVRELQKSVRT